MIEYVACALTILATLTLIVSGVTRHGLWWLEGYLGFVGLILAFGGFMAWDIRRRF